jgi:signal transduction histidine kinase
LFMVMRSWYTDRTWAQPEAAWWIVITAFRIGVMTCCVTTVMTLWNLRLHNFNVLSPLWLCLALCGVIILHSLGVIDSAAWGYRAINLVFAVMILIIALASWWQAKSGTDGQRLRSKTFGQILLIGYLPVMVTTPLWTFRPDLQQIAFLQNIAVGVVAMPIVIMVAQSAQYQLHAFWWRLWLVLVAAVAALVGASVMVLLSGFSASASLGLMLIFTTASIYGLRGWLEKRLIGQAPAMEQFLPQIMALQGLQGDAMEQAWQRILQDAFAPQRLVVVNSAPTEVRLVDQGDSLLVPALGSAGALSLTGAGSYTRSFGRSDALLVSSLHALALQGLQARESFVAGAVQERRRIAADLHDDIGGKLLHLANSGGQEASYARNTLEDLRTITRGLSAQPRPLSELLADIQYQLGQRAERADIELGWETTLPAADSATMIGSRQSTVLASICSELLRNAMQHQGVRQVHFHIGLADWTLQLQCDNDGAPTDPMQWKSGLGTTSIRRRVHDLQGQCAWASRSGGGASFSANWPLMSWLSADTGAFQMDQLS